MAQDRRDGQLVARQDREGLPGTVDEGGQADGARLGETRVKLLAAYVLSLGRQQQPAVASAGNADEQPAAR